MELPRAAKLIRMLSSPSDGEVLSAARALCRMGIHDVAERVENGPKFEPAIRYARPRQTREIARLSRLVEELQSQVARFVFRSSLVCGKPFRAGRADASTCSARCRTRLCGQPLSSSLPFPEAHSPRCPKKICPNSCAIVIKRSVGFNLSLKVTRYDGTPSVTCSLRLAA